MKRPFALIGITYLSVQAALFYLESDLAATILTAVLFYRNDCFALYT